MKNLPRQNDKRREECDTYLTHVCRQGETGEKMIYKTEVSAITVAFMSTAEAHVWKEKHEMDRKPVLLTGSKHEMDRKPVLLTGSKHEMDRKPVLLRGSKQTRIKKLQKYPHN